ncbi:tpd52 like 2b isoform X2 [Synchiropus splendidus]|uniref:tpd52 like 2b isoform X2 n=1 Tax=Synchiropus splendidus TaxID=270530 RepID=UPI00237DB9BF|nr:tpd52 like 2b isoform X2 [Synchiropus splendidus]
MTSIKELFCQGMVQPAEREAALAVLEKQLTCPICREIFNKPVVILPCQHNLCRKCANELYQPSLFQARTTMMVNSGRFRCPSCKFDVVLDRHGVYGLQRNLLVENIIDIYKEEVSNPKGFPMPSPPLEAAASVTCSDHEGEKVNIFCVTCQVPTCSLCKVFGAHQSCQVAPLTDIHQQQKDELSREINSLKLMTIRVQALVGELEESRRSVEESCDVQRQMVRDKFDRMFSILEEKRKVMTQQISSEEEEKTGSSLVLMRRYGDRAAANSKLLEQARSSMEEADVAEFVQSSRELITQVLAAAHNCQAETPEPAVENMSHYRYNFRRQERALRSVDFDKDEEDSPEEFEDEPEPAEPDGPPEQDAEIKPSLDSCVGRPEGVQEQTLVFTAEAAEVPPPEPVIRSVCPTPVMDCEEMLEVDNLPGAEDMSAEVVGQTKYKQDEEREHVMSDVDGGCATKTHSEQNTYEEPEGMSTQQAVTLIFYLLAFLLLLQRFWAYIGFFICT